MTYRLSMLTPVQDFRLFAVPVPLDSPDNPNAVRSGTVNLRPGGTAVFQIRAVRRLGFAAPIDISVDGLPPGVQTRGARIEAGSDSSPLILEAAEDAAPLAVPIRIVGRAVVNDQEIVREARGGTTVWGTGNRQQQTPAFRATQDVVLAVMRDVAPVKVDVVPPALETARGGKVEVPVRVTRRRDFGADLQLVFHGLPNELKPGDLSIKGDAGEAKFELQVTNKNARAGHYSFYLRADTKAKLVRNPDAVPAAEAQQKAITERTQALEAELATQKQAAETAVKAATDAAAALEAAKQAAAADGTSPEKQQALQAATKQAADTQQAQAEAQQLVTATEARVAAAQQAKAEADKALEEAKKANEAKDVNFVVISTPVRLHIQESPLVLQAPDALLLRPGETTKWPLQVQRRFGFADKIELSVDLPKEVSGIAVEKVTLEPATEAAELQFVAQDSATPGTHTITVHARASFNGVDVASSASVALKVEPRQ
jgi:hypothetical protein